MYFELYRHLKQKQKQHPKKIPVITALHKYTLYLLLFQFIMVIQYHMHNIICSYKYVHSEIHTHTQDLCTSINFFFWHAVNIFHEIYFSCLSPYLSLSGIQTYRNPAQLQQSQRGKDAFPVPWKDRRQGGQEPAESETGVSGKGWHLKTRCCWTRTSLLLFQV